MSFSVLFVCTGNVCRSPMAEMLFRAAVAPGADVEVDSAGLQAPVGRAMDPPSVAVLRPPDLRDMAQGHRARQCRSSMGDQADLVLTAQVEHRELVLRTSPAALRRAFAIKEFARLARHLEPGPPRKVVAPAADMRALNGQVPDGADDIVDPYRGGPARAQATLAELTDALDKITGVLVLPSRQCPRPAPSPQPRRVSL